MEHANRRRLGFLRHLDANTSGSHGLDMRRPLLNKGDIKPGSRQVGADRRSVCPSPHYRGGATLLTMI